MANLIAFELLASFTEEITMRGQVFAHPASEKQFEAIIDAAPAIDPRLELGNDLREHAVIRGRRDTMPLMHYGDLVQQLTGLWFSDDTPAQVWRVTKREDNPANIAIKYWVVKVTDADPQE
jgi:hypothetical protein